MKALRRAPVAAICAATLMMGQAVAQPAPAPNNFIWQPGYLEPGLPKPPYVSPETPQGTGPYPAIMVSETTVPGEDFVAYYPVNLSQFGKKKLPVLMWANGSCLYVGNRTRHFLQEIASHGYVVMAGGALMTDKPEEAENIDMTVNIPIPNPDPPTQAGAAERGAPGTTQQRFDMQKPDPSRKRVTHALLESGIKWLIAENARPGSKFAGKLDTANIAVMGTSCGGGVAGSFAGDPLVKTIGVWNMGFATGGVGGPISLRSRLNQPLLNLVGDPRYDIGYWDAIKGFEGLRANRTKAPVFYAWRVNMVHMNVFRRTNGGEVAPIAVAWLDWHLKGDQAAAKMFAGLDCGLCSNSHYHIDRLNIR